MSRKHTYLYTSLVLVAVLAIVHYVASTLYLYWTLWWFDNVVHFLGGVALGFFALYFMAVTGLFSGPVTLTKAILYSLLFVMIFGVCWEIFEYVNGLTQSTESYPLDVMHDLLSDALGAIAAPLFVRRSLRSS